MIAALLAVLLLAEPPPGSCVVSTATDGDTFVCTSGESVRLLLIDAPELKQGDVGIEARDALRAIIPPGTKVELSYDKQPRDRYGRLLAYVRAGQVHVNATMIAGGWAVVLHYAPNGSRLDEFLQLEMKAQKGALGVWNRSFCRPRDFRRKACPPTGRPAAQEAER